MTDEERALLQQAGRIMLHLRRLTGGTCLVTGRQALPIDIVGASELVKHLRDMLDIYDDMTIEIAKKSSSNGSNPSTGR